MTDAQDAYLLPRASIPSVPGVDTPRDSDGVLGQGAELVIGNLFGALSNFFVGPPGKVRRGGTPGASFYPATGEGWSRAWAAFEAGDPVAAAKYRRHDEERQLVRRREQEVRAEREDIGIAVLALRNAAYAVVDGCRFVSGYGCPDVSPVEATLFFLLDRVEVLATESNKPLLTFRLDRLLFVHVDGPGSTTTGGGFAGGGAGRLGRSRAC